MNSHPLISIVIPVYNGSDYVSRAIESALSQTYPNIEILVINDGSRDDGATEGVCLSYGDRIRYFHKENGGVSTALNVGLQNYRGDFFSWLSHDDEYLPDKLLAQMEFRIEHNLPADAVIYGDYYFLSETSRLRGIELLPRRKGPQRFLPLLFGEINGCTLLIPRGCLERAGIFDPALISTQDYDMWLRLCAHTAFYHHSCPLVRFRVHSAQGSRKITTHAREVGEFLIRLLTALSPEEREEICRQDQDYLVRTLILARDQGCENAAAFLDAIPCGKRHLWLNSMDRSWQRRLTLGGLLLSPRYSIEVFLKKLFIRLTGRPLPR